MLDVKQGVRKNIRVIEKNSGKTRRANPRENSNNAGEGLIESRNPSTEKIVLFVTGKFMTEERMNSGPGTIRR